jgi:hypothetical protein
VGAGVDGVVEVEAGEGWSSGGGRRQGREGAGGGVVEVIVDVDGCEKSTSGPTFLCWCANMTKWSMCSLKVYKPSLFALLPFGVSHSY